MGVVVLSEPSMESTRFWSGAELVRNFCRLNPPSLNICLASVYTEYASSLECAPAVNSSTEKELCKNGSAYGRTERD